MERRFTGIGSSTRSNTASKAGVFATRWWVTKAHSNPIDVRDLLGVVPCIVVPWWITYLAAGQELHEKLTLIVASSLLPAIALSALQYQTSRHPKLLTSLGVSLGFMSLLVLQSTPSNWTATAALLFTTICLTLTLTALASPQKSSPTSPHRLVGALTLYFLLLALPVIASPYVHLMANSQATLTALLAASPISHLSSVLEFDVYRSAWFYKQTVYAGYDYHYPSMVGVITGYCLVALGVLLAVHLKQIRQKNLTHPELQQASQDTPKEKSH